MRRALGILLAFGLALLLTSCDFYKMIVPQPSEEHYLKGYVKDAGGSIITDASIYVVYNLTTLSKGINDSIPYMFSFTAMETEQHFVNLQWVTETESNMTGFYIYRSTTTDIMTSEQISTLIPATNTNVSHEYSYLDTDVTVGSYYYWLQSVDTDSLMNFYGPVYCTVTLLPGIPNGWGIHVSPNPVSNGCTISYDMPEDRHVQIWVKRFFDATPIILFEGNSTAGRHALDWDGTGQDDSLVCNGIYTANAMFTIENSYIQDQRSTLLFVNNRQVNNKPYTKSTSTGYRIPIRNYLNPGGTFISTDLSGNPLDTYQINGNYYIYVKKTGYHTESRTVTISNNSKDRVVDFILNPMVKNKK